MLYRDVFELKTETNKFYDITDKIANIIKQSRIADGICNIFLPATTAGLLINENDRMLIEDYRRLLEDLAPDGRLYQHPENAQSHLKAAIFSQNVTVPITNGKMALGTWQNIILWEFDETSRDRKIIVTIIY